MSFYTGNSMTKRDLRFTPFLFFLYRDVKRFYKVRAQTVFSPLSSQALYLLIFGVSLGRVIQISEQFSYLQFIIPGLVSMTLINQPFQNGSSSLFGMKITGEIIDLKSSALSARQIVLGAALSGLLRGVVVSLLTFGLGQVFHKIYEGQWMSLHSLPWLMAFLCLGGLAFAMAGVCVGMWSKSFDHVGAISGFVALPLIYLGGVFFDLDKLSPFWQQVSRFNPMFYFVNGIRYSFLGVSDTLPSHSLLAAFAALALAYTIACWSVAKGHFHRAV